MSSDKSNEETKRVSQDEFVDTLLNSNYDNIVVFGEEFLSPKLKKLLNL